MKNIHKNKVCEIKALKTSSQNVLQFKLDEMTKKMKNEIYRLQEESRRHEESQKNEDQKINNHINYLKENCDGLDKAFKGIVNSFKCEFRYFDRVVFLEKTLGPILELRII